MDKNKENTDSERDTRDHRHIQKAMASISLEHLGDLVASFHDAEKHYFGKPIDRPGVINSIISRQDSDGKQTNEVISQSESMYEALYDTFLAMRRLEKVRTKPLVQMDISPEQSVDFTNLEHYAPKIAPTADAYPIPDHLKDMIEGNELGRDTYNNTIAIEGWDEQLFTSVRAFCETESGVKLVEDLRIHNLQTLTPEQAVKLTLAMVQDLMKYSYDKDGEADGSRADTMTTMELLNKGFRNKNDTEWQGNGICRNIASNVKAVFEAIKRHQSTVNMLHNTYVGYEGSFEDFRAPKRYNAGMGIDPNFGKPGHAWNTVTTIDAAGNASVTVVDVTWALEKSPEEAIENMDYTLTRSARNVRELYNRSSDKEMSFYDLNRYYETFLSDGYRKYRDKEEFDDLSQFVLGEYVEAVTVLLKEARQEWLESSAPSTPSLIAGAARRLGDNLSRHELQTLFRMSEYGSLSSFDGILQSYVKGGKNTVVTSPAHRAEAMIFSDETLSERVLSLLDDKTLADYANNNARLRAQIRQYKPELLSTFDPYDFNDQRELVAAAEKQGLRIHGRSPTAVQNALNLAFKKAAGDHPERVAEATNGLDIYQQVVNFPQIIERLLPSKE